MIPYYILIFSPFVLSLVNVKGQTIKKKKQNLITLFFLFYLLMLVCRHFTIGRDLPNYLYIFRQVSYVDFKDIFRVNLEPAYVILNKIVAQVTDDFQWVIAVTSLLTIVPIWYIYQREIEDPLLSISMFIILPTFVMFFSGLRQSIAVSFGALAYEMTKMRKLKPFLLIVFIAVCFHYSAFILFVLYPLYHAKITRKWLIYVIPSMCLVFIFNKPIFSLLQLLVADIYEVGISDTGAYTMLIMFVLFGVFSFMVPAEEGLSAETIGLRNILLLVIAIQMFVPLHNLAMRMNYYFIIYVPILIPKIINQSSARWKQVAKISRYVMIAYFMFYFFDHMPSGNILDTFPYRFFWEIGL